MLYQHPENAPLLRDGIPKKTIITTQLSVTKIISRQDLTKGICHSDQYVLGFTYYLPFSVAGPTNKQTNKQAKPMETYSQNNKNSLIGFSSKNSETTALVVACISSRTICVARVTLHLHLLRPTRSNYFDLNLTFSHLVVSKVKNTQKF